MFLVTRQLSFSVATLPLTLSLQASVQALSSSPDVSDNHDVSRDVSGFSIRRGDTVVWSREGHVIKARESGVDSTIQGNVYIGSKQNLVEGEDRDASVSVAMVTSGGVTPRSTGRVVTFRPNRELPPSAPGSSQLLNVPPFVVAVACVLVCYCFFHCLYMHCYTERRQRTVRKTLARVPTLVVSDGEGVTIEVTPMLRYENDAGRESLCEAQPFLVCKSLPSNGLQDDNSSPSNPTTTPGLSKFWSKLSFKTGAKKNREDQPPSISTVYPRSQEDADSQKTHASICFVPIGDSIKDPTKPNTEWTPLHGFVYSSFVLTRHQSYRRACNRDTRDTPSPGPENGDKSPQSGSPPPRMIVIPSRASLLRSLSQPAERGGRDRSPLCEELEPSAADPGASVVVVIPQGSNSGYGRSFSQPSGS